MVNVSSNQANILFGVRSSLASVRPSKMPSYPQAELAMAHTAHAAEDPEQSSSHQGVKVVADLDAG